MTCPHERAGAGIRLISSCYHVYPLIFLDGEEMQVPVTRNLYTALRSLRLPRTGRRLWIDALCINQRDHEEKKIQLGLMRRVDRQAEKAIARADCTKRRRRSLDLVPVRQRKRVIQRDHRGSCLEDFGLPREDGPLWDSWRRMFASPYFRRIWIPRGIALGRILRFWFGNAGGDSELLFAAHGFLGLYSGTVNTGCMALSGRHHSYGEDTRAASRPAMVGSRNAAWMYRERLSVRSEGFASRLVDMLTTMTTFQTTDARDKIYALPGLTCDGAFFAEHVSYVPWDSAEGTSVKFAKLFVEKNEGIEVLLQVGFRDEEGGNEWPSWIPARAFVNNPYTPLYLIFLTASFRSFALRRNETSPIPGTKIIPLSFPNKQKQLEVPGILHTNASIAQRRVHNAIQQSLAAGFRMIFAASFLLFDRPDSSEGVDQVLLADSPAEYYRFLRRAMNMTKHRRGRSIGL
ncbi:hypothetical protein CHU98_g10468 [Xylaria longipes]|nr:hypothetical protein CHU98_g10468 [Xylaria longipes]